jgi:tol-pal system protein YbgF
MTTTRRAAPWVAFWVLAANILSIQAAEPPRVALVIGNAQYQKSPALRNPANDAADMAARLQAVGFTLVGGRAHLNAGRTEMARLLRDFGDAAHEGDTALFYYAGHGIALNGDNWLIPVDDSDIRVQEDVPDFALSSKSVVARMEQRGGGTNILILDACRNNPLPDRKRSMAGTRGLARLVDVPTGTFVLYAASENQAALDGDGRNGLFTSVLLKLIGQPGLRLDDLYYQTLDQVSRASGKQQEPMAELKLTHPFYFVAGVGSPAAQQPLVQGPVAASVPVLAASGTVQPGSGSSLPEIPQEDEMVGLLDLNAGCTAVRAHKAKAGASDYSEGMDALRAGSYAVAAARLKSYVASSPTSISAPVAQYRMGSAYLLTHDYESAADAFQAFLQRWPEDCNAPYSLLKLGYAQYDLKNYANAQATLTQVAQKYPGTDAAKRAGALLQRMGASY